MGEDNVDLIQADEYANSLFIDLAEDTHSLAKQMSDPNRATLMAREVDELLTDIGKELDEDPEIHSSQSLTPITELMRTLKDNIRNSSIGQDHLLWVTSRKLSRRLTKLQKFKTSTFTTSETKDFHRGTSLKDTFKVNKVYIPKFAGGVENWHQIGCHQK